MSVLYVIDLVLDRARKLADSCTSQHNILLHPTRGGGTGSGLGCQLLERVDRERWTDRGWTCDDEVGHFSLIPELEPHSAWMSQNCQQMRGNIKTRMYVSQETSREVVS